MTLQYIYDRETFKYLRTQEKKIDPRATAREGRVVYVTYPNATDEPLPQYGEHEVPYFIDGEWILKQNYKEAKVYNKDTKSFETCYKEELAENQVFIDDPEGIKRFEENPRKYMVNENYEIVENPKYPIIVELDEVNNQLAEADTVYNTFLDTPQVFPANGHLYKPKWCDDGTYTKIITGAQAGLIQFPINIWDATEKEENMVSMDQVIFGQLCAFLALQQAAAFDTRKELKSRLIARKEELERELAE